MDERIESWIADYCKGCIGRKELEGLRAWVEANPEHEAMLESCVRLYRQSRGLAFAEGWDEERSWRQLQGRLRGRRRVLRWWTAVAASMLVAVGVGLWAWWNQGEEEVKGRSFTRIVPGEMRAVLELADGREVALEDSARVFVEEGGMSVGRDTGRVVVYEEGEEMVEEKVVYHSLRVPRGGEYHLELADGTRVWVNSGSEVRFPNRFVGERREIFLSGEVYLEVVKDVARPFVVHAGEAKVTVLGTSFNVAAYPGENWMVTTLVEGKVEVGTPAGEVVLVPGKQVVWDREEGKMEVREVDTGVYTSWVEGQFEFENMALENIARQLERWYDVSFEFADEGSRERRFTGGVRRDMELMDFLRIIERTTNVKFVQVDDKRIIVRSC